MKLLTDKTYVTRPNTWYAAIKEFKNQYPSGIYYEFMNTTSSAGDWDGFLVQKLGKNKAVAIRFSQQNNYPDDGFTLYTAEHPFYSGDCKKREFYENAGNCWK
jgi:hypothetical protein